MQGLIEKFDSQLERLDKALISNKRWLAGLFLLPFFLKLLYVLQSADSVQIRVPIMDGKYYDELAQDIVAGNLIRRDAFFMGPLYPYFLALVYSTLGRDFTLVRLIQAAAGSASVLLTYFIGVRLFRPSVALLGAALLIFYGAVTFYEGQILMMWMGTALNLTVILLLLRIGPAAGWPAYAAAGAVLGLSALARANVLLFLPVVWVWIVYVRKPGRRYWKAAAFCGAVFVALLPATIHNYLASRDFVLVTSNAGVNFYIGNNENANGIFYPPPGTDFVTDATTRTQVERLHGRDMKPSEVSRYWMTKSARFIYDNPAAELKLLGRKLALFFNGYEIPQIESYDFAKAQYRSLKILFVNFWFLVSLALLGLLFSVSRWKTFLLLQGYVVAYAVSIILFFVTARYRVQIAPVISLFAANALLVIAPRMITSARRLVATGLLLSMIILLTQPGLFAWDENEIMFRERIHQARRLSELGDYKAALVEADGAIELFPDYYEGYIHRAIIHKKGRDYFKSIEDYTRALDFSPRLPGVRYDLAQTFRQVNLLQQAIAEYKKAIELDSLMIEAYNNLGITYGELGQHEQAVGYFKTVLEMDPAYTKAYNNLGAALGEAGRVDEAIATFERAIEVDPAYSRTYMNLAMAYISQRRIGPAVSAVQKYLELNPADENARGILDKLRVAAAADTAGSLPER